MQTIKRQQRTVYVGRASGIVEVINQLTANKIRKKRDSGHHNTFYF